MTQPQQNDFESRPAHTGDRLGSRAVFPPVVPSTLRSASEFRGFAIHADRIPFGVVQDLLFDDFAYICRYFRVRDNDIERKRPFLISPLSISHPDWKRRVFPTVLTPTAIETSPPLDPDQPITRKQETVLAAHFNWPEYWGFNPPPDLTQSGILRSLALHQAAEEESPRLRGLAECIGYRVESGTQVLGYLDDVIVDTETWALRYLVVDTEDALANGRLLIALGWIADIGWSDFRINVDLPEELVRKAPAYDALVPLSRDYETRLFEHYQRAKYW